MSVPATGSARSRSNGTRAIAHGPVLLAVHTAQPGGAERMALAEAAHLGHSFELIVSIRDGPLRDAFAEHAELVDGVATLPLWGGSPMLWAKRSIRTLRDAVRMAMLIRRRGVQLVLTSSSVCLAPVLAARLARVPVVVHARDVPKSRLAPLVFALEGALAQTVIVIASGLEPYFRRGRRARIARIADGIAVGPPGSTRADWQHPLQLCLVGGIDRRKGQDIAVAALARLREHGVAATLELVGREIDQDFARAVRKQVQELGLTSTVEFVGEVSDARPYLDRADIVVAPSRGEWTPLVLMEALAQRRPVIAARVGEVGDVVTDHESGLLIAPEDPQALAAAILELVADPPAAAAMAERGRSEVERRFAIERTLAGLEAELLRLLDASATQPASGAPIPPVR